MYAKTEHGSNDFVEAARQYKREQESQATKEQRIDVFVQREGSIFLFCVQTAAGMDWINEHVPDATWFGDGLCVENRFALEIASAMTDAGLRLQ